ncbi:Hoc-like head decoration [Escherichia phage Gostya9]|uniref:Decorating protein n=1 Tax=Escherichia phage Gostya9 TaxID=2182345 RepID=A0A2U8UX06_9CAUD|nr:Hoc-like head decoration [Escherichia phage Gostya9]AWN08786.1 decorating protein [Escherichia phage Gostya9]
MIDYNGLKTIFGENLPESHIFFATVAAHEYVPSYAFLRRELGLSSAHTNRKVWKKFVEAYDKAFPPLAFTKDLDSTLEVDTGEAINLSVTVSGGTAPYTYAWTKDGSPLEASGPNFTKATAAAEDAGTYKVVVTDSKQASITSVECVTTVIPPLTLSTDLAASMSVEEGAALTLSVTATGGTGPYTYAWTKDGSPIPDASEATYTKPAAAAEDAGSYKVTVTDSKQVSKDSTICAVTVNPVVPGD